MSDFLSKEASNRSQIYELHKSIGVLVLILVGLRIFNRIIKGTPALPNSLSVIEKNLAHLVHFALYALMIVVPLSGYLMSNSYGYPVHFFGIEMPMLTSKEIDQGKFFSEVHESSAFIMLGLITLHILGALKHRFFDKPESDVLKRML